MSMFSKLFGKKGRESAAVHPVPVHGIDSTMNYCPRCGDEYRADITICAGCKVSLISGEAKLAQELKARQVRDDRSMELLPEDELVTIRKGSVNDIKSLKKLLS